MLLSILMTDGDEDQVLRLSAASAPSLGDWDFEGFVLDGSFRPAEAGSRSSTAAELRLQVVELGAGAGPLTLAGRGWAWALPLPSGSGPVLGHLVVSAAAPPSTDGEFLLQVLAQQTGVALSNARLHERERIAAEELLATNAKLEQTVAALRHHTEIHDRLTTAAAAEEGRSAIAVALHELTKRSVAIEDRYGNLRAWAGPGQPDPYPKDSPARRQALLGRLRRERRPMRDRGRLVALAVARPDVVGLIALTDPDDDTTSADVMALEHGVTVLAVELARLRGLVEAELRLRGELVNDLLNGMADHAASLRAEVLGHDLGRPHRMVLIEGQGAGRGPHPGGGPGEGRPSGSAGESAGESAGKSAGGSAGEGAGGSAADVAGRAPDGADFLLAVRQVARNFALTALIGARANSVVIVTGDTVDWNALRAAILRELGGGHCRIGVGEPRDRPSLLPGSRREAELALRLQTASAASDQVSEYARLGVFRMLAALPDQRDVQRFVRQWLGKLIDYDTRRGTELVTTLTEYLEHGGNYAVTARQLSVHRNTLKYRMQRIRELSGLEPNDPNVRFNLQLAARAWATLRALHNLPADPD